MKDAPLLAGLAQWKEQLFCTQQVGGLNPSPGAKKSRIMALIPCSVGTAGHITFLFTGVEVFIDKGKDRYFMKRGQGGWKLFKDDFVRYIEIEDAIEAIEEAKRLINETPAG